MPEKPFLKYLFIVNSGSGRHAPVDWDQIIHEHFKEKETAVEIYPLPTAFSAAQIKSHIEKVKPSHIIAVGGDGTVTMLANILAGSDIILGIIPAGSANGMAKELNIPADPAAALKVIEADHEKKIDMIRLNNEEYCLHLSDIGLNAQLIKYFDEGKVRGQLGYASVILKTLWRRRRIQASIHTGDADVRRDVFMVVLANARMYGTGAVINPDGKPDDGKFEVILVRKLSVLSLFKMLIRPGIFNPKHIEIISCTHAEITTKTAMHFQADGEYKGKVRKLTADIAAGTLKMIVGQ